MESSEYLINPAASGVFAGLGWDVNRQDGDTADFDLDASAFMLAADGRVTSSADFIYYKNLRHPSGAVAHTGDNTTGEGEGDDEAITVSFADIPAYVERIVFTVSIYEAVDRGQSFGQVKNAYIRLYDNEAGELFRYSLEESFKDYAAVIFGEFVRDGGTWKFRSIGEGVTGGIVSLSLKFGVFKK